jgi:exopolyphosphatase/guanosine-5'-triphosphate,3'-diphosphate pyrophosphatase
MREAESMPMNVAVIDVGSHTVRLLVAYRKEGALHAILEAKATLRLGVEVERHGRITDAKLEQTAGCVSEFARAARQAGAARLETFVTAPGRQAANGADLAEILVDATGTVVRVLSPDEEGKLAFRGAVQASEIGAETVAVVDVGGGSTEVAVGTVDGGPAWVRSFDIGAVRLTGRALPSDPPSAEAVAYALAEAEDKLNLLTPPLPQAALATGGTARALRKLVGNTLGPAQLDEALDLLESQKSGKVASRYAVERHRARTLAAGAVILRAVQRRLCVPLVVARTGLREGAVLTMLEEFAAAA